MIEVHDLAALERCPALREAMHQQRFRAFKLRHGWDVASINGFEIDQFDRVSANPIYLLARGREGELLGSCRLLQMSGPNMLHDVFGQQTGAMDLPRDPGLWECTRYTVEPRPGRETTDPRIAATLFAALCEWGIPRGMTASAGMTDMAIVRFMHRLGIEASWVSEPIPISGSRPVVARFEISEGAYKQILSMMQIENPVIMLDLTAVERTAA
jgi:acyl homoserine lactone synthase